MTFLKYSFSLQPNTYYKIRIRFVGDFSRSVWSYESEWIKTLESLPFLPPEIIQAVPYESSSILIKWRLLKKNNWNSDKISYRILYKMYPSDNDFSVEDVFIPDDKKEYFLPNATFQHIINKLLRFDYFKLCIFYLKIFRNLVFVIILFK